MFAFAAAEELVGKEARGAADTGPARDLSTAHSTPSPPGSHLWPGMWLIFFNKRTLDLCYK